MQTPKIPVPTLQTERLELRAITPDDIPAYQRHFDDYEIISQLSVQVPWPYPADGARKYLATTLWPKQGTERWDWGIFLKNRPAELIGSIGIWRQGCPVQRGFWLGKAFWGQGLMTEAVKPMHDFAFNQLGFSTLILSNAKGNIRSRRIKEKSGAKFIGTIPTSYVNKSYAESEIWELSRDQWNGVLQNSRSTPPEIVSSFL